MLTFSVFKNPDSRKLLGGQLVSQICDRMTTLGLVWIITQEISASWVPWFLGLGALPHLLLSWKAGGMASRWGELKTVIYTDLFRCFLFVTAAFFWSELTMDVALYLILLLTVFSNTAGAFFNPAIFSLPNRICQGEELPPLTAAIDSCFSFSSVIGPALVAALYPWIGLRGILFFNGVSYGFAAFLESGISLKPMAGSEKVTVDLGAKPDTSFTVLRSDHLILFVLGTFCLMNLVLTPMLAFLPLFSSQVFHGQMGTLAALEFSLGAGTVIGSLVLTLTRSSLRIGTQAVLGITLIAAMDLLFSLNRNQAMACVILVGLGFALSVVNVSMMTFFQTRPKADNVPVVMSLVNLISVGVIPVSMILVGGFVTRVDLRTLAIVLASVLCALAAVTALNSELRKA